MPENQATLNANFIGSALDRNYAMQTYPITGPQQTLDLELDSVPGWAHEIILSLNLPLTFVYTGAPSWSPFAPWNFFSEVQISLGGGPFQRVSPYYYFLRELASHDGWMPSQSAVTASNAANVYALPAIPASAGSVTVTVPIRIPLQAQHGSPIGLIPLGSASTKMKIRLTTATSLNGSDSFLNPTTGGTGVTITVGAGAYVQPNIDYFTTPPTRADISEPKIGYVLNVQQRATSFIGAGSLTPVKFPDPFRYLRLWHIVIDGTGAPNSGAVTNFELDITPGYPQYNFNTPGALQAYLYQTRRRYNSDLPTGVFCFDLWSGTDPRVPNGTQAIDGSMFQTMQTQLQVASGTNVASPARIITFAEALSPVGF